EEEEEEEEDHDQQEDKLIVKKEGEDGTGVVETSVKTEGKALELGEKKEEEEDQEGEEEEEEEEGEKQKQLLSQEEAEQMKRLEQERVMNYKRGIWRKSGKFLFLYRFLPIFKKCGHRVLIFTQFKGVLDMLEEFLTDLSMKYCRLDGSIDVEERIKRISEFNAPGSELFCFILTTRAGGLGINLQTADTVIVLDRDWNPQQDLQASDRVYRIGQEKDVLVINVCSVCPVEERMEESIERKLRMSKAIVGGVSVTKSEKKRKERKKDMLKVLKQTSSATHTHAQSTLELCRLVSRGEEEEKIFIRECQRFESRWFSECASMGWSTSLYGSMRGIIEELDEEERVSACTSGRETPSSSASVLRREGSTHRGKVLVSMLEVNEELKPNDTTTAISASIDVKVEDKVAILGKEKEGTLNDSHDIHQRDLEKSLLLKKEE
ncbi:hypothetical protein ADUPG1_008083, partial [Aduncisulcus paluster]